MRPVNTFDSVDGTAMTVKSSRLSVRVITLQTRWGCLVNPKKLCAYELCHILGDKTSTQAIFISHMLTFPANMPAFKKIYHTKFVQFSLSLLAHKKCNIKLLM